MSEMNYPGSRWWKFDFHNHTPASSDFDMNEINTLSPRDWLLAYMRKGIDCVAVTDHNCSEWIEKLQITLKDLAKEDPQAEDYRPLVLFPGIEITTSDSLHVLAIFSPEVNRSVLDGLLVGKLKLSNVGKPTAELMFSESTSTVIDCIHDLNGLAIAAHVEKDKGLLQGRVDTSGAFSPNLSVRLIDAVLPKLDGLEFQSMDNDCCRYFVDRIAGKALVSGSDWPHNSANAGSRFCWVKMSEPSFDGLRLALLDPESALRRSDEKPDAPQSLPAHWIQSITLEKMHLRRNGHGSLVLPFNPAYNAVIGGRGSGKSTVLECLRLAFSRENELKKLGEESEIWKTFEDFRQEYVQRDKPGMILPDTQITVEVIKGKAEAVQRFKYIWMKSDGRFRTRVMYFDNGNWQDTGLDEKQASALFPVKIFSQKQILALANNPQALLEYIDDSIRDQKYAWLQKFDELKSALLVARLRVRTLKKELEKKPALELEYNEVSRKARVFANANFGSLLRTFQRANQQNRALDDFLQLLTNDVSCLQKGVEQASNLSNTELTQFLAESDAEHATLDGLMRLKQQLVEKYQEIVGIVKVMQGQLDTARQDLAISHSNKENQKHIQDYQDESERLKNEGINSAEEAAFAVSSKERLSQQLLQINAFEVELGQAELSVEIANQALTACREELTLIREQFIAGLFDQNTMLKVSLCGMGNAKDASNKLRAILRLPDTARFEDIWSENESGINSGIIWDLINPKVVASIGERLETLKSDIESKDKTVLYTTIHGTLVKRIEALQNESFDELAKWFPEDEVCLEYRPSKDKPYKNIALASAGQKTAAMLSFLLVHGDEPLLLDQPEDDLDNALVSELVVEQLRKNKVRRQLLVVTHNANIVVNADAELVVTMDFDGQINLASMGGLQETSVRRDICRVMEGGEEAFRQRYKRILEDLKGRA